MTETTPPPPVAAALDRAEAAEAALEHAKAALAGDNEGVRLWMLDCGELVAKHRARAEAAEAKLAALTAVILPERFRSLADAEHVEAAAAVLERRYPAARPEQLDTVITELHSIARAWRRIAREASRG